MQSAYHTGIEGGNNFPRGQNQGRHGVDSERTYRERFFHLANKEKAFAGRLEILSLCYRLTLVPIYFEVTGNQSCKLDSYSNFCFLKKTTLAVGICYASDLVDQVLPTVMY